MEWDVEDEAAGLGSEKSKHHSQNWAYFPRDPST